MSNRVLLVGGSGFLGKNLVDSLKCAGLINLGCLDVVDPGIQGVKYHQLNILSADNQSLRSVIKQYDIIVNCSGQVTTPINTCLNLNSAGIDKITSAVKKEKKFFLHFSTVAVYGSCEYADESSDLNPETAYSAAKAVAEFIIENKLTRGRFCILRLSNLYGEAQPKGVFSYLYRSYKSDKVLEFNNDGDMVRYYLHVKDCANIATTFITEKISGKYNLIGPDKYTLQQLVGIAENITGCRFKVFYKDAISWDNALYIADYKLKDKISVRYHFSIPCSLANIFGN